MTSRLETAHRFIGYPDGHAVGSGVCVRCGQAKTDPVHRGRRAQIRWKRLLSDDRGWRIFGGGGHRN